MFFQVITMLEIKWSLIVVIASLSYINAANILLTFPIPSKSHAILGDGIVRSLLGAGHQVSIFSLLFPYFLLATVNAQQDAFSTSRTVFAISHLHALAFSCTHKFYTHTLTITPQFDSIYLNYNFNYWQFQWRWKIVCLTD